MDNTWGDITQYGYTYWPWPIAVYLFLAGLSAGAAIISVVLRHRSKNPEEDRSVFVRAGALIAPIAVILGLALLVVDLAKPAAFWLLLVNWNLSSVMSLGVLLLVVYTPLTLAYALAVFKERFAAGGFIRQVADFFDRSWLQVALTVLALGVGIYTGFLLSAMVSTPLYNNAVLPLLFLVSGISAGIAATVLVGLTVNRGTVYLSQLRMSSNIDSSMIIFEVVILFMMFVGLHYQGGAHAAVGWQALTHPVWGVVFWAGVIGVGIVVPLILHLFGGHENELPPDAPLLQQLSRYLNRYPKPHEAEIAAHGIPVLTMVSALLVIVGSLLLRLFVVYAGQLPIPGGG